MAAQDFRYCPECGSRNKVKWEFCARCGHSLQDVPVGERPGSPSVSDSESPLPRMSVSPWPAVAAVVVAVAAVIIWRSGWTPGSERGPDPGALFGRNLASKPAPSPTPLSDTAAKFAEAMRLASQGDMDSAVPLFEQVLSEEPRSAPYHAGYANALWAAGRRDLALAQLREAADIAPVPNRVLFARRLAEAGQREEAIRQYDAVLAANPSDTSVAGEFGTVLNEAGDYARAAEVFRVALASTANPEVRAGLAFALEKTGDTRGAATLYRQILDENGARALVRARLADLLVKQGDPQSAVKLCQDGLKLTPDAPLLHTGLGSAYDQMGKWKEAAAEYRESVRLAPNSESAKPLSARAAALEKLAEGGS